MSVPGNDVTAPGGGPLGSGGQVPPPQSGGEEPQVAAPDRIPLPRPLPLLLAGLGGGLGVGAAWALFGPLVADWAGELEDAAARDVTFGLLGVLAGLVTSVVLLIRPGARPALQSGLAIAVSAAASLLAWGVGRLLGARPLHAVALVVIWPLVASSVTLARSLIGFLFAPEIPDLPEPSAGPGAPGGPGAAPPR